MTINTKSALENYIDGNNSPKFISKKRMPSIVSNCTVANRIVEILIALEVSHAFGVGGGAIAPIWSALEQSSITVKHFRHEAGAAFAATEAYFTNNRPVVVFTTTDRSN